jgi:DNA-binding SARP family transcriptional activator
MTFGLLGPLLVRRGGREVRVQRGGQRALLAVLLLDANRTVSADAVTDMLWGPEPPLSALDVIRHHVWRLRQALGEAGRERIVTHARAYRIRVSDGELDLHRFTQSLAASRGAASSGSWQLAASRAAEALSLWRGEPLADVDSQTLQLQEVPRLAELRLQAEEAHAEAELHLGHHGGAAAELGRLCAAYPLREHPRALLMLALYRCGRQADALAAYQNIRHALVAELGAEPGHELQHLHHQILATDPVLEPPRPQTPATVTPPGLQSGMAGGAGPGAAEGLSGGAGPDAASGITGAGPGVADGLPGSALRQLPAAVTQFTGRAAELTVLAQILARHAEGDTPGTVVISAIGGTAGVGKTALAIHFAHQAAPRFPDGQLYVNLRGFDPASSPAAPAEAIRVFLEALGVPADRIPPSLEGQAGLYRSLLAGRRMLIVLDNARDEQQVRPLLPASPGSLVIVTSRHQLTGLAAAEGARLMTLDVLRGDEARQMLADRIADARAAAELPAIAEIASLCAGLPLALAVAAARASARPQLSLAALAGELRDAGRCLEILDADDPATSVRAVISWSYDQLSQDTARLFRLLGTHPGPDISLPAAASLIGLPPDQTRRLLAELTRAHLITERTPGRYAFHDLLRAYAAELGSALDSPDERAAAIRRVLDHYLHTARAASLVFNRREQAFTLGPLPPGVCAEDITGYQQAMAWFETEHRVLLNVARQAADTGLNNYAWQLPETLRTFLDLRGYWEDYAAAYQTALAATMQLGDLTAQAIAHRGLAVAQNLLGRYTDALTHYAQALELYRQLGDRVGQGRLHQDLISHQVSGLLRISGYNYSCGDKGPEGDLRGTRVCMRGPAGWDLSRSGRESPEGLEGVSF